MQVRLNFSGLIQYELSNWNFFLSFLHFRDIPLLPLPELPSFEAPWIHTCTWPYAFHCDISSLDMSIKVETTSMFALQPLHFDKIGTSRSWLHLLHLQQFTSNKWMGMAYFAFLTFTMIMRNSLHIIRHLNWLWMRHNLNFSSWIPIIVFKQVKSFP